MNFEHKELYEICRAYLLDQRPIVGDEINANCGDLGEQEIKRLFNKLEGYVRSQDFASLAESSSLFSSALHGVRTWSLLRQVEAMFRKNAAFANDAKCLQTAMSTFLHAETRCRIANRRLEHYYLHRDRLDQDMQLWLSRMEADIRRTLGSFSAEEDHFTISNGVKISHEVRKPGFLQRLPELVRLTSGATARYSRQESQPYRKIRRRVDCTSRARPYIDALARFHGFNVDFKVLNWNRVEFVPKSWKTHRTIACEPTGNLPLQLAFDVWVKERLRREHGIDLSDQDRNQRLAAYGSLFDFVSTVDLAAASDSLTYNAVEWLLPPEWFKYLCDIRSPCFRRKDLSKHGVPLGTYAKFSSMGNGATFGLETLIFSAACRAVGSKYSSVYGDDIVIETSLVPNLMRVLRFLGFKTNEDKTFTHGPFRESCGLDVYEGFDVTPFYIRKAPKNKPELAHLINGLVSIASPDGKLAECLRALVKREGLLCTVYSEDTMSGVHVDIQTAYSKKYLVNANNNAENVQIMHTARYVTSRRTSVVDGYQSLVLWYLDRYRLSPHSMEWKWIKGKGFNSEPDSGILVRSRTPTDTVKYRVQLVPWYSPGPVPLHLFWWTEFLEAGEALPRAYKPKPRSVKPRVQKKDLHPEGLNYVGRLVL